MLVGKCNFYGIEVLALDVLDECHLHHILIVCRTDIGGNGLQACHLRSTPAALASYNLIGAVVYLSQGDRLNDTDFTNTISQLLQRLGVKLTTRLVGIRMNLRERNLIDARRAFGLHCVCLYQCIKAATESREFLMWSHIYSNYSVFTFYSLTFHFYQ